MEVRQLRGSNYSKIRLLVAVAVSRLEYAKVARLAHFVESPLAGRVRHLELHSRFQMSELVVAAVHSHLNVRGMIGMNLNVDLVTFLELVRHSEALCQIEQKLSVARSECLECDSSFPSYFVVHAVDFTLCHCYTVLGALTPSYTAVAAGSPATNRPWILTI